MEKGRTIISIDPSQTSWEEAGEPGPEAELRPFTVGTEQHGQRLDRALAQIVPEFSRSYLQQLIDAGAVRLSGRMPKASHKVKAGEQGEIELRPTPQSQAFVAEPMPLAVMYEDEHLLVIDKPADLVVHPAPGHWGGTLLNGLLARDQVFAQLPRAGIVHRLDMDTSGLMVVARTRATMDRLVAMIAARDVSRQYLALAHRPWQGPARSTVDAPIGRDPRNRLRMAVVDPERHAGKPAQTTLDLLENAQDGCWVKATLHTGRTHQIRVHMAHLGHPLVGDALYGGRAEAGMHRQALHAFRLAFSHPVSGMPLAFHAPPPADLREALRAWGLRYNESQWLTSQADGAGSDSP